MRPGPPITTNEVTNETCPFMGLCRPSIMVPQRERIISKVPVRQRSYFQSTKEETLITTSVENCMTEL